MYKNLISDTELISLIPIYSRSIDEWRHKYNIGLKKYLDEKRKLYEEQKIDFDSNMQHTFEIRFNERYTPWRYNDIVGYIELRRYKNDLQFYFFKNEDKKIKLDSFEYDIESYFKNQFNNQKTLVDIGIKELQKKFPKFKNKYFDKEMFLTILKHYGEKIGKL
jgi:hypothetical protein